MLSATIVVACVLCREGRKEKDVKNSTLNKRSFICISTWALRAFVPVMTPIIREKKSSNFK